VRKTPSQPVRRSRMLVQDCYIHDTPGVAAFAKGGATGCVFERNLVANAGLGICLGQYTDLPWFDYDANPTGYELIDGIARNNIIVNTTGAGIALYSAYRARVLNNTLIDVAEGNQSGIMLEATRDWRYAEGPYKPCVEPTIINNVVLLSAKGAMANFQLRPQALKGKMYISNNAYWRVGKGWALFWDSNDYPAHNCYVTDLAGWQKKYGDAGSIDAEPGIDSNYHLAAGSPCRGTGVSLPDVKDDYDGTKRAVTASDIGATQYRPVLLVPRPPSVVGTGGGG
jgi:hypothetical protein